MRCGRFDLTVLTVPLYRLCSGTSARSGDTLPRHDSTSVRTGPRRLLPYEYVRYGSAYSGGRRQKRTKGGTNPVANIPRTYSMYVRLCSTTNNRERYSLSWLSVRLPALRRYGTSMETRRRNGCARLIRLHHELRTEVPSLLMCWIQRSSTLMMPALSEAKDGRKSQTQKAGLIPYRYGKLNSAVVVTPWLSSTKHTTQGLQQPGPSRSHRHLQATRAHGPLICGMQA